MTIITTVRAVGPAVNVVRRHYGMDHLHEPAGVWIVRLTLVVLAGTSAITLSISAIVESFLTFNCLRVSLVGGVLPLKCKGTREYVRKPPSLPLARETAGVR